MSFETLTLIALTASCLTAVGQDKLEWTEKRKLEMNDFRGTPPDPSTNQTLIARFGLEMNLRKSDIERLTTLNGQVANIFSSVDSWIDWREQSRLRYARTLFDLNEWKARELRKRLNENRKRVLEGDYQTIEEEVRKEFDKIIRDYENESS